MPLHSHVFENGCPRMPPNEQNGCPRHILRVKNRSLCVEMGHPLSVPSTAQCGRVWRDTSPNEGEEQQGRPICFTGSERSGPLRNVPRQASSAPSVPFSTDHNPMHPQARPFRRKPTGPSLWAAKKLPGEPICGRPSSGAICCQTPKIFFRRNSPEPVVRV